VSSGIGEGKVSKKWVREAQLGALGFSRNRLNNSALKNVAGTLPTGGDGYALSVGREVKTEIPVKMASTSKAFRPRSKSSFEVKYKSLSDLNCTTVQRTGNCVQTTFYKLRDETYHEPNR
jgi:hypothetical protein